MSTAIDSSIARAKNFDLNGTGEAQKNAPSRTKNVDQKGGINFAVPNEKRALPVGSPKSDSLEQIAQMIMTIMESLMKMISSLIDGAVSESPTKAKSGESAEDSKQSGVATPRTTASDVKSTPVEAEETLDAPSEETPTTRSSLVNDTAVNGPTTAVEEEGSIEAFDQRSTTAEESTTKKATTKNEPASSGGVKESATTKQAKGMQALTDETGAISVLTEDGYTIKAEGKDQAWTITAPDGKSTRIWGDPHVYESDGDKWDFKDQSTFKFGKNKVTVETVPAGNGETFSARLTVYSGDERVTIDGIEANKPTLRAVSADGEQHDASLSDGTVYERGINTRGESWATVKDGKRDVQGN
jgi:hypothetical protein